MDGSPRLTHMTRVIGHSVLGQLTVYAPSFRHDNSYTCNMAAESGDFVQLAQAIKLVSSRFFKRTHSLTVDLGCQEQQLKTRARLVLCTIRTYSNTRCLLWN